MVHLTQRRLLARTLPKRSASRSRSRPRAQSAPPALLRMLNRSKPVSVDSSPSPRARQPPAASSPLRGTNNNNNHGNSISRARHRSSSCSRISWAEKEVQDSPWPKHSPRGRGREKDRDRDAGYGRMMVTTTDHVLDSSSSVRSSHGRSRSKDKKASSKLTTTRAIEMRRERLQVQRRDRSGRRKSILLDALKEDYHASSPSAGASEETELQPAEQKTKTKTAKQTTIPRTMPVALTSASTTTAPSRLRANSRPDDWHPPRPSAVDMEAAKAMQWTVTAAQQSAVKDWLLSLGISIWDGEGGGYGSAAHARLEGTVSIAIAALPPPPLPLHRDRLRNGQMWCELLMRVEPRLAGNANLHRLAGQPVATVSHALDNLEKALWLFQLVKSPPLPTGLVCLAEDVLQGKAVLWALLWEIMQAYCIPTLVPYHAVQGSGSLKDLPVNINHYRPHSHKQLRSVGLDYTPEQRRLLDQSLLDWLEELGKLTEMLGHLRPLTILALESYLKDGTLLCEISEQLGLPVRAPLRHPHTYSQCLSNVTKCLDGLRTAKVNKRFLYAGVEEEIVRGHWDAILGLLEDMHIYYDSYCQPQPQLAIGSVLSYPYLGKRAIHSATGTQGQTRITNVSLDRAFPASFSPMPAPMPMLMSSAAQPAASFEYKPRLDLRSLESDLLGNVQVSSQAEDIWPNTISKDSRYEAKQKQAISSPSSAASRYSAQEMTAWDPAMTLLDADLVPKASQAPDSAAPAAATGIQQKQVKERLRPVSQSKDRLLQALALEESDTEEEIMTRDSLQPALHEDDTADTAGDAVSDANTRSSLQWQSSLSAIKKWLHAVGIRIPDLDAAGTDVLQVLGAMFSDGVLLGRLVQKLERDSISGLEAHPKTTAQKLQNVRRVLDFLAEHNKRIPLRALGCEQEVLEGDGRVVLELLESIRKGYPVSKV